MRYMEMMQGWGHMHGVIHFVVQGESTAQKYVCALILNLFGRNIALNFLPSLGSQLVMDRLILLMHKREVAGFATAAAARLCRASPGLCG